MDEMALLAFKVPQAHLGHKTQYLMYALQRVI